MTPKFPVVWQGSLSKTITQFVFLIKSPKARKRGLQDIKRPKKKTCVKQQMYGLLGFDKWKAIFHLIWYLHLHVRTKNLREQQNDHYRTIKVHSAHKNKTIS
jgi:hypothetical protein